MTDKTNNRTHDSEGSGGDETESNSMTKDDWKALETEPDNAADLGYQLSEWEQFEVVDDTDQVVFLPSEQEEIEDAAFLVADSDVVVDLQTRC